MVGYKPYLILMGKEKEGDKQSWYGNDSMEKPFDAFVISMGWVTAWR